MWPSPRNGTHKPLSVSWQKSRTSSGESFFSFPFVCFCLYFINGWWIEWTQKNECEARAPSSSLSALPLHLHQNCKTASSLSGWTAEVWPLSGGVFIWFLLLFSVKVWPLAGQPPHYGHFSLLIYMWRNPWQLLWLRFCFLKEGVIEWLPVGLWFLISRPPPPPSTPLPFPSSFPSPLTLTFFLPRTKRWIYYRCAGMTNALCRFASFSLCLFSTGSFSFTAWQNKNNNKNNTTLPLENQLFRYRDKNIGLVQPKTKASLDILYIWPQPRLYKKKNECLHADVYQMYLVC